MMQFVNAYSRSSWRREIILICYKMAYVATWNGRAAALKRTIFVAFLLHVAETRDKII